MRSASRPTIGFARRAAEYKRSDLLFTDEDRPLQVLHAGKAHPQDEREKAGIRRIYQAAAALAGGVPVV